MSESTASVYKTLSWLLAILLFGAVALLLWHSGKQGEILAAKDAEIAHSDQLVVDIDRKLAQSEATLTSLRAEIEALNTRHGAEKQELTGKLDAATQSNQTLQSDMEALQAQHAQILASEREKASQAHAELRGRHDAAGQQIIALGADIEQLKRAAADAAAAHEAQTAEATSVHESRLAEIEVAHKAQTTELERQLNERIDFYRTALEGSDPERAAQLADLERAFQENEKAIAEAQQAVQATREKEANLNEQLASANQLVAERERALSETGQRLEDLQAGLTQEQSARMKLQQKHDETVAKTTESLAAMQQQHEAAEAAHKQTKSKAAAAMQAAIEAHTAQMTAAESKISDLTGRLQAETAALGTLKQEHNAVVAELRSSLGATKQTLASVEAELSAAEEAASQMQQAHEQQIGEVQWKVADLQQRLAQTRQKAAQDLLTNQRESEEAMTYVRGVYTELSKLGGRHTDRGILLSLAEEDLRFRISKTELPDGELSSLDSIAELLVRYPELTARIEGHTDGSGRQETNLELSQERASSVKEALVERGVNPQRITAEGIGEARPIADNANPAGRRKNRRVEIYILED